MRRCWFLVLGCWLFWPLAPGPWPLFAEELPAPAAAWNPHAGLEHLFVTGWDHRGATRYPQPQQITTAIAAIQWANATLSNTDRPAISQVFPSLIDARNAAKLESWRIVEPWQWRFEPVQGGGRRWVWSFDSRDVSMWELHLPAIIDATGKVVSGDTYTPLLNIQGRDSVDLCVRPSQVNSVSFGMKKVRVWGSGKVDVGPYTILPDGTLVWPPMQTTTAFDPKTGAATHLKVIVNGKRYRVRLEPDE